MIDTELQRKIWEDLKELEAGKTNHARIAEKRNISRAEVYIQHEKFLVARVQILQTKKQSLGQEVQEISNEKENLTTECYKLSSEKSNLTKEVQYIRGEYQNCLALKDTIEQLKAAYLDLKMKVAGVTNYLQQLDSEIREREAKCQKKRIEVATLYQEALRWTEIKMELEEQVKELENRLKMYTKLLEGAKQSLDRSRAANDSLVQEQILLTFMKQNT